MVNSILLPGSADRYAKVGFHKTSVIYRPRIGKHKGQCHRWGTPRRFPFVPAVMFSF